MNETLTPLFDIYTQTLAQNPILRQLILVLIYSLAAKGADFFIDRVLRKIARKTDFTLDDKVISLLHSPIALTIIGMGFLHAFSIRAMDPPWHYTLPALVKTLLLILWLVTTIRLTSLLFNEEQNAQFITRGKIGGDLFNLIKNVVLVIIAIMGTLWILSVWQIDLTPLFASAGIAGIAVALAAKDTLANFFGGISVFMDNTYKVGDYIIIDNTDRGEVVDIGIRSTRIKTRDDVLITIPNSIMANAKIINESAPIPLFRIRVPVSVAYGSDLETVERVMLGVVTSYEKTAHEPEPRVRLRAFGSSSVDYELLLWVDDPRLKGLATHEILRLVYQAFAKSKITIPFPQMDLHVKDVP